MLFPKDEAPESVRAQVLDEVGKAETDTEERPVSTDSSGYKDNFRFIGSSDTGPLHPRTLSESFPSVNTRLLWKGGPLSR